MKIQISLSALKPSQYREYVKAWNRNLYKELFLKFTDDPKAFRIYIPYKGNQKPVKAPLQIRRALETKGYTIDDYVAGYAIDKKDPKRRMRIGRLLTEPQLKQTFDNDKSRQAYKNKQMIVISRHPYDIAGMSTDRGWTSCMNLKDGSNKHKVKNDIDQGSLIAYLVDEKDPDIKNPKARVLIKPFYMQGKDSDPRKIKSIEQRTNHAVFVAYAVYGTASASFLPEVNKWLAKVNRIRGVFKGLDGVKIMSLPEDVYDDNMGSMLYIAQPTASYIKKQLKEKGLDASFERARLTPEKNTNKKAPEGSVSLRELLNPPYPSWSDGKENIGYLEVILKDAGPTLLKQAVRELLVNVNLRPFDDTMGGISSFIEAIDMEAEIRLPPQSFKAATKTMSEDQRLAVLNELVRQLAERVQSYNGRDLSSVLGINTNDILAHFYERLKREPEAEFNTGYWPNPGYFFLDPTFIPPPEKVVRELGHTMTLFITSGIYATANRQAKRLMEIVAEEFDIDLK